MRTLVFCVCVVFIFTAIGCTKPSTEVVELKMFPVDSLEGIITQSGVEIDKAVSSDGNGSLKITATEPTVVRLFEVGDIDIENARLIYQAKIRTDNIDGKVYLEMRCNFSGKGEFFSRGLQTPLKGTTKLDHRRNSIFLEKG
jgi:hypothetical protein